MGRRAGDISKEFGIDLLLRHLVKLCLFIFAVSAVRFSLTAAPGVPDIAHLQAIALPFGKLLGWLVGSRAVSLMPAPSHTAPLPLLLDALLWRIDPFGLPGLRLVHLLFALGGIALLLRAIAMRMDQRTALVAGLLIALSPRFIEAVVNMGADPYVLTLFCCQLAILLTRGKIGGREPLLSISLLGAASGLCGVSGALATGTLFAMLLFAAPDRAEVRRRLRTMLPTLPFLLLPILLQLLFESPAEPFTLEGLVSLGTKLMAHNADLLLLTGVFLRVPGMAVLILVGLIGLIGRLQRNGPSERSHPFALLLAGCVIGTALVVLAGPMLRIHLWSEPTGHAWLSLLIGLLAAASFTPRLIAADQVWRRVRLAGAGAMIAGALVGTIVYHYRAEWFGGGSQAGLDRALEAAGPGSAIIYTGPDWDRAYFPHSWLRPGDMNQWLLGSGGGTVQRILPGGRVSRLQQAPRVLDDYATLILVRIDRRGWRDLRFVVNSQAIGAMPPARLDHFSPVWRPEPAQAAPGEYWLTTQIVRRKRDF